jgi:hypothetical protein
MEFITCCVVNAARLRLYEPVVQENNCTVVVAVADDPADRLVDGAQALLVVPQRPGRLHRKGGGGGLLQPAMTSASVASRGTHQARIGLVLDVEVLALGLDLLRDKQALLYRTGLRQCLAKNSTPYPEVLVRRERDACDNHPAPRRVGEVDALAHLHARQAT